MAKGFDYSRFSNKQLMAAKLMADPDEKLSNGEIAKACGTSERTFYRWKNDPEFIELVNHLAKKNMDSFKSEAYKQVMRSVKNGNIRAIELILKYYGDLVERREVVNDINVEITSIEGKSNEQLLAEIRELEKRRLAEAKIIDITAEVDSE
jgi:hypothetical protein